MLPVRYGSLTTQGPTLFKGERIPMDVVFKPWCRIYIRHEHTSRRFNCSTWGKKYRDSRENIKGYSEQRRRLLDS
ncbi:hypothetical protein Godav_006091 [Gossypium davidsonii]|uniref:Uncharacterized protein n=1 Tax=Gossypium davidsonii TaxID=34287 RepID=A0A7J8S2L7_GOSDV|nr:hypothetical protein [Gossypium davidsonii]